jgi:hypothetical protein
MIDIAFTLAHSHPGSEWTLDGDNYAGLKWLSDLPKPTEQEISDAYLLAVKGKADKEKAQLKVISDARAFALSLGFTDAMVDVMYPQTEEPISE